MAEESDCLQNKFTAEYCHYDTQTARARTLRRVTKITVQIFQITVRMQQPAASVILALAVT